jgi:putative transposase
VTQGLKRYQFTGDLHFITFSCFRLQPYLRSAAARSLFEQSLERMRKRYDFYVVGYVVMPEHVHLLVSEPANAPLSKAILALKLSISKLSRQRPFWQARYYDFNIFSGRKHIEKLRYIHRNPGSPAHELCALGWKPVKRGLVKEPLDWQWSSFRHYATGERGIVEIESFWTAEARERARRGVK